MTQCATLISSAQVGYKKMTEIFNEVKTPYKYGLVVAPDINKKKFDCPTVFREGDKWYMTYVCYDGKDGNDGRGYETWLSESEDLLHWQTIGKVLEFSKSESVSESESDTWDKNQRGGFPALIDNEWGGSYKMLPYKGKRWMSYIGGSGTGYEAINSPLSIGLAYTKENITQAMPWNCLKKPILSYADDDAQWWEKLTQYKSNIYKVDKKYFGYPFVMFYNAGGRDDTHPKGERIGIALSKDMLHWKRYDGNPVFAHDSDGTITGDAQIVRMNDVFVMFYFSAYNPTRKYNAYNTFAASYDLVHWTDWEGEDLIIPSKPYDEMFAHKSYVVKHNGTVYHFYCAVNNNGQRGIALATSRHIGKSEISFPVPDTDGPRFTMSLNDGWNVKITKIDENPLVKKTYQLTVDVPFNIDDYYGALQYEHGNLHGEAVCTKKFFIEDKGEKEYFLRLEGVGTYAEIILNGQNLGRYDIGRTCETVNVTKAIKLDSENTLIINVSHPSAITDMPWVCGGCSSEWGFSEGSQPFGIFRPVTLEVTDKIRVEPFGVHVWSNGSCDSLFVDTEIKNYSDTPSSFSLISKLCEKSGKQVLRLTDQITLQPGETRTVRQQSQITNPTLWTQEEPYLYHLTTLIKRNGKTTESTNTDFGFRTMKWVRNADNGFYLNGKRTFINGVCEYEHLFGQSHAFTSEQIETRIRQVESAGFNAFRDAHQPHNLHYKELLDAKGILWWSQFSAHIWYDTPQFRSSFKRHLRQWVKERRNSPSLILWGLQNESTLPKDFAEECTQIIREMDPTCGTQRLVTTCNGGEGTDWNVVQNWSGTYGGNIDNYANELKQSDQLLNGEYGAWRTLGNHTREGYTEENYLDILRKKVTLAESVKDSVCGQFLWLLNSHDNPGRRQPDEALRKIDKVGPFNYKGLFTIWDQPTDAYYWFKERGNLGTREQGNKGIPKSIDPQIPESLNPQTPQEGASIWRINCGGDDYVDKDGNLWLQDNSLFSHSWGDRFEGVSSYQCSQTVLPESTGLSPLFRTCRWGRHELYYHLPAQPGDYKVELYFVEPWYKGSIDDSDYENWRLFDVAINDSTVIHNLDVWSQVGYGRAYKRTIAIHNTQDEIKISFPKIKSGQAVISAIAIYGSPLPEGTGYLKSLPLGGDLEEAPLTPHPSLWQDFDSDVLVKTPDSLLPPKSNHAIEVEAEYVTLNPQPTTNREQKANLFAVCRGAKEEGDSQPSTIIWNFTVGVAKVYALRFKYHNPQKARKLHVRLTDKNGVVYKDDDITFLQTQEKITKRKSTSITTGDFINAGTYQMQLIGEGISEMIFDKLTIE